MPNRVFAPALMRERPVVEVSTPAADTEGQPVDSWATFATIWARVEYLTGLEREAMLKIVSQVAIRISTRYRADLTEKMRITWSHPGEPVKHWNINALLPDEKRQFMEIMCTKVE